MVSLKDFFAKKLILKKISRLQKNMKNYPVGKEFNLKLINELWHKISNNVVCATSKGSDGPGHMRSLVKAFASRLNILWLLSYWLINIWSF